MRKSMTSFEVMLATNLVFVFGVGIVWLFAWFLNPNIDSGFVWLIAFVFGSLDASLHKVYCHVAYDVR
jgi:hypothetical protein